VFARGLEADGGVHASGVQIGRQVDLRGAKLHKPDGDALNLDGAQLSGGMFAEGLEAHGGVHVVEAQIGGQLDLSKAKLHKAGGDASGNATDVIAGGYALSLRGTKVPGGVFARGLEADGEVRAPGGRFGGALDLREAKLRNCYGNALNLESASIERLILEPVEIKGQVRVYGATITGLKIGNNPPGHWWRRGGKSQILMARFTFSPNARSARPSRSPSTSRSLRGQRHSPTRVCAPPLSTG
jgi:hypothetical protein